MSVRHKVMQGVLQNVIPPRPPLVSLRSLGEPGVESALRDGADAVLKRQIARDSAKTDNCKRYLPVGVLRLQRR